eukprot:IDg6582t1
MVLLSTTCEHTPLTSRCPSTQRTQLASQTSSLTYVGKAKHTRTRHACFAALRIARAALPRTSLCHFRRHTRKMRYFPFKSFGSVLHPHLARQAGLAQPTSCSTSEAFGNAMIPTARPRATYAMKSFFAFDAMRLPRPRPMRSLYRYPSLVNYIRARLQNLAFEDAGRDASVDLDEDACVCSARDRHLDVAVIVKSVGGVYKIVRYDWCTTENTRLFGLFTRYHNLWGTCQSCVLHIFTNLRPERLVGSMPTSGCLADLLVMLKKIFTEPRPVAKVALKMYLRRQPCSAILA